MNQAQTTTVLLKPLPDGNWQWLRVKSGKTGCSTGNFDGLLDFLNEADCPVLVVPAEYLNLSRVDFQESERKHLAQTLKYSLEDDLSEDVDKLHLAMGAASENQVTAALVDRELMQQWLAFFRSAELSIKQAIPETLLIPANDSEWTLVLDDQRCLVRPAEGVGFVSELGNLNLALRLKLDESDQLPSACLIYGTSENREAVTSELPEMLRDLADFRNQDYWSLIEQDFQRQSHDINLLQGDFALALPWNKWWRRLRLVAGIAAATIVLELVTGFIAVQSMEKDNLQLRTEIEQVDRQVVPKGQLPRPLAQVRRKVNALKGDTGEGFTSLYNRAAAVIAESQGVSLQAMTYNERNSELRVTLLAPSFKDIETMRGRMETQNLRAELTGSSNEGSQTRARLRIGG